MLKKYALLSLFFVACTPPLENTPPPTPTSAPISTPTATPVTATPGTAMPVIATAAPENNPSSPPSLLPSPSPSTLLPPPSPSPSQESLRVPPYTGTCPIKGDDIGLTRTTMNGRVVNENDQGESEVTITVRSLEPCDTNVFKKVVTDKEGQYRIAGLPYGERLEIEIAAPSRPSGFYQTRLSSNKQQAQDVNYFPFRVPALQKRDCAGVIETIRGTGTIAIDQTELPSNSEALIHFRSLDSCDGFSTTTVSENQKFSLNFRPVNPAGQMTLAFAGRPTKVENVALKSNKIELNQLFFELSATPKQWVELPSQWTSGTFYDGTKAEVVEK
jgi:hypothetical protein